MNQIHPGGFIDVERNVSAATIAAEYGLPGRGLGETPDLELARYRDLKAASRSVEFGL